MSPFIASQTYTAHFVAEQQEPVKRKVALKVIKPGMDTREVMARFTAERQALALMDHPNIARVLDAGATDSGRPYFVMELVRGIPIAEYCDQNQLSPRNRLDLFVTVCQAVQHAHQKGIIHRDIKPSNVLVTSHDGKPVAKVIDFGVAKAISQQLTERSIYTNFAQMIGTPLYMSPEQAEMSGLDIDTRSDIYSLGVLLYELLTGTTPLDKKRFAKAAYDEVRRMIREEEPQKPSTRLSTSDSIASIAAQRHMEPAKLSKLMRGDLDWITMKALEKDRTRRYETANGLARDIQRYLSDEPVEACPPSATYRLRKFVRKNRVAVRVTTAFVCLAFGAAAMGAYLAVRATDAERKAAVERDTALEAQRKEAEQRTKAEKARDRTRDVLDAMTSSATGDSLSTQKEISADQKKFLTEVLTYYREFAGEKADDEQSRSRIAQAAHRVGRIEDRLGRKEQGIAAFQMAVDGYRTLAADFPGVPAYRHSLANNTHNVGTLLADLGKRAEAEEHFRRALSIREKLADEFPGMPAYRRDLALSHNNLGNLMYDLGKRAEAEEQYRKALAIQASLAADFPAVPAYRHQQAITHGNLGNLLLGMGKRAEGEEQHRQALAMQKKLTADFPAVPVYRNELARGYHNLGFVLADLGKRTEAKEQIGKALAIWERLAADFPTVPDYRKRLAGSHNNLGNLLKELGKQKDAEEQYRKSLAIREKLAADDPAVPDYRQELASSHSNLGLLFAGLRKRTEAVEHYRQALAVQENLVANFSTVPAYQTELGESYFYYGDLVRSGGNASESLSWYDKAIATLAPVHRAEPRGVIAKKFLRNSHVGRARAYDVLTKHAEAVEDWDRAIELGSPAEQLSLCVSRATSRLNAGLVAEAVAEVGELTKTPNLNAGQCYDFACFYVFASGKISDKKQAYADRAMELLHMAAKAGYKDAAHMKKDTDLDPLRDREDFKKLVAELEAKVTAEKK